MANWYRPETQAYKRLRRAIGKWIAADCIQYSVVESEAFRSMTRNLDPKCPAFGRKAITSQVSIFVVVSFHALLFHGVRNMVRRRP